MRNCMKRGLSLLLVLMMVVSMTITVSAAGGYTYNWGTRGATATVLSAAAEKFYADNDTSYDALAALSGAADVNDVPSSELYKALQKLMKDNHSYINNYDASRDKFQYTDCQNGGGKISSFYSGAEIGPAWDKGSTWNREHTWPDSKGLAGSDEDDIMMLRPTATATSENGSRGNKAYGESSGYYNPNSVSNGTYDLRGDVARIMLYVYVRWGNTGKMWGTSGVMESKDVLLKWMEEDPVDTWELGRNDSVESITGTRNVFVDYPELAFTLFGEVAPADMVTPSGEAAEVSGYTITAIANDDAFGTVSVTGKAINAVAAQGYEVAGYEVVSGEATVTRSGNSFVVDAASDCTICINFAPKANNAVCVWENGELVSAYAVLDGETITLPQATATPEDYTFVGWSTGEIAATTEYPTEILKAESSYVVDDNTNLYAVYTYTEAGGESYLLVTDASQLYEGAQVVIAAAKANKAMSTTQNSNNRGQANITKNSDKTITLTSGVAELTLGKGTVSGSYTFYCSAKKGYLYCASTSSKNYLRTQSSVDAKASFVITVNSDGSCKLASQISGINRNLLQYNSSNGIFACYGASSNQNPVALYVKTSGNATYYSTGTAPECAHTNAVMRDAVDSDCVNAGVEAGLYCDDCQKYVFGGDTIDATGHFPTTVQGCAPTCTETGLTNGTQCCICLEWLEAQQIIDALGHTEAVDAAVAPTCTETGLTEGSHCSVCGETVVEQEIVDALGHTEVVDAAVTPTCTEPGLTEGSHCSVCGETVVEQEIDPATGHFPVTVQGYAPTCTETGLTDGIQCCVCLEWSEPQQVIDALGHSYEDGKCTACDAEDPDYDASPDTGDMAPVMAVVALGVAAAAAFVVLAKKRRA